MWCEDEQRVKDGPVARWVDGYLAETGFYALGQKAGTWTSYRVRPRTSSWMKLLSLPTKYEECHYVGGARNGAFARWAATGRLAVEGSYKNGLRHGVWVEHLANGFTKQTDWLRGQMHGEVVARDANGRDKSYPLQ